MFCFFAHAFWASHGFCVCYSCEFCGGYLWVFSCSWFFVISHDFLLLRNVCGSSRNLSVFFLLMFFFAAHVFSWSLVTFLPFLFWLLMTFELLMFLAFHDFWASHDFCFCCSWLLSSIFFATSDFLAAHVFFGWHFFWIPWCPKIMTR